MICRADHQRTVTMHQILEIRSSFADWLLPPPMYDDESLGDYIIHVQCLPSCREQTRNNESNPIPSCDGSLPNTQRHTVLLEHVIPATSEQSDLYCIQKKRRRKVN